MAKAHTEVARAVVGQTQRQTLCLRLLPRLLARQRRRGCSLLCRRLPLRRPRDAQRCLLGGGKAAQGDQFAITFCHPRLERLGVVGVGDAHAEVARLVVGHAQRQPLRLCLLPRLLTRQRRRRCSPGRGRLPFRRPCDAQRGLLGRDEAAQVHQLAITLHPRIEGLGPDRVGVHAEVARLVVGLEQRQLLRSAPCSRLRGNSSVPTLAHLAMPPSYGFIPALPSSNTITAAAAALAPGRA
eukprot:scaffold3464_cov66-Phaeocystis_antarctica.AAC.4